MCFIILCRLYVKVNQGFKKMKVLKLLKHFVMPMFLQSKIPFRDGMESQNDLFSMAQ